MSLKKTRAYIFRVKIKTEFICHIVFIYIKLFESLMIRVFPFVLARLRMIVLSFCPVP